MFRIIILAIAIVSIASSNSITPRIVGGKQATKGSFPYQISIRKYFGLHQCGGSIINNYWILTAAHCVHNTLPKFRTVVVGSNQLKNGGVIHTIDKIICHPSYNTKYFNDIAVIKLKLPIQFNNNIQPIKLDNSYINGNEDCVLSGWGRTGVGFPIPNHLQYIELKTIDVEKCKRILSVADSELCTLTKKGEGACDGDSGSPLVARGMQIGIVSRGCICALGYPDIFTRISFYLEWINSTINV